MWPSLVAVTSSKLRATAHLQHSPINVEWCDNFWESQVLSNSLWHAHLIDPQVWIRSDDRSC